jgi:excinuclease ABC subunit C
MLNANLKSKVNHFPQRPGVYIFVGSKSEVLYIGKALSLKDRVSSYFLSSAPYKSHQLTTRATNIKYIETGSEIEALLLEANLIKKYHPQFNVIYKDDKSYLYVFISLGEEFPKVFLTRKPKVILKINRWEIFDNFKGVYFGPFPSTAQTQELMRWIRKIFPFCAQKRISIRPCFYSHLKLCNPCPNYILKQKRDEQLRLKKIYRNNIFNIKKMLDGKISAVYRNLEIKMKQFSDIEDFENASLMRNRIFYLQNLMNVKKTGNFLKNTDFYFQTQQQALQSLKQLLESNGLIIRQLEKIECYDISNLSGTFAVGSQVVFISGIPEKSLYKKYKIRSLISPNDTAMMKQMIARRLNHREWIFPDLIVIDGGKPQLSIISKLMKELEINIPVIGIAKRIETIVLLKNTKFLEINLSKNTAALKLIQAIRDESHRFAIAYHRKIRNQILTNS